jgi:hypothetical protein
MLSDPAPRVQRAQHETSALLRLPAEMRNSIYEMLFVRDDLVQLGLPEFEQHGERYVSATQLFPGINLLATCHQVHYEGRTVLCSRNIFSAKHRRLEMMAQWLESIGSNAAHVKRVLIDLKDPETRTRRTESLGVTSSSLVSESHELGNIVRLNSHSRYDKYQYLKYGSP